MFNAINDPVLAFVVIALVMLLSPLFAKRLRVPDLVLLLVSGAVLGPNGLGLLERNAAMTLFGSVWRPMASAVCWEACGRWCRNRH